ncbi:MAG: SGNH/GDSL hydrolase family protein [Verrucomicrobiales bacterium]|nr:SGNH/GDSL hydrolase family protein [Verrucomicrobiales bacterium]
MRFTLLALNLAFLTSSLHARDGLPEARRILFLGDSITYGGTYVAMVEAAAVAAHPDESPPMLNLGLSSETVSGLSEDGHAGGKFPRPDLHERLGRILPAVQADLVVACYGMNDGIYLPLAADRFQAFKDGMIRLHEAVEKTGAKIIHLTPPVFDPQPIRQRVRPAASAGTEGPFEGYDDVLAAYADWLLQQRDERGWTVLDVHGPMVAALEKERAKDPTFAFAKDGVHPNEAGHAVMARPLLTAWNLPTDSDGMPQHPRGAEIFKLIQQKQAVLRDAWLTETRHLRPGVKAGLPLPEAEKKAAQLDAEARRLARQAAEPATTR